MTLAEFKAWFEGFTEGIESAPTAEQFAKIKTKVEKIDGAVTTQTIFINDWYRPYRHHPYWANYPYSYTSMGQATSQNMGLQTTQSYAGAQNHPTNVIEEMPFNSAGAFRDLGRREAATGY